MSLYLPSLRFFILGIRMIASTTTAAAMITASTMANTFVPSPSSAIPVVVGVVVVGALVVRAVVVAFVAGALVVGALVVGATVVRVIAGISPVTSPLVTTPLSLQSVLQVREKHTLQLLWRWMHSAEKRSAV